jgi:hypothetical protein
VAENLSADYRTNEAHFEFMPDNYFRACDVPKLSSISNCSLVFCKCFQPRAAAGLKDQMGGFSRARPQYRQFCTWELEQLLAKIAGSFSVVQLIF